MCLLSFESNVNFHYLYIIYLLFLLYLCILNLCASIKIYFVLVRQPNIDVVNARKINVGVIGVRKIKPSNNNIDQILVKTRRVRWCRETDFVLNFFLIK